eukprot:TRINITY_DN744_c0_g1::TRINITY_DN744_c0_g1_i1::g.18307::m.18307 TRINITY_DN744_c0_g1::TRINITY_DN744_c0_g1_i1::g.18307  ORF type:complete len:221 (+),score=45.42,sp/P06197/PIS_YEAST/34.50/1e-23,CDP-OH_P_transf/PF01066.16/0.0059 TRINITY_DN744_c0_g1_i1:56-718(+)
MESVWRLPPNQIAIVRGVLGFGAFLIWKKDFNIFIALYIIASLLGALGNYLASANSQRSKLGAVLSMVTDRFLDDGMIVVLTHFYPEYFMPAALLISIDISSHWVHMVVNVTVRKLGSHKEVSHEQNFLIRLYYGYRPFLMFLCLSSELFLICAFIVGSGLDALAPSVPAEFWTTLTWSFLYPCFLFKQFISTVQLLDDTHAVAISDAISHATRKGAKGS